MTELWAVGLVLVTDVLGAAGAILLKKGSDQLVLSPKKLLTNYPLIAGVTSYALSVFTFVPALRGGQVSVLFPLISLSYVMVALASVRFLNEKMTKQKWLGIALVMAGVALIGFGS